MSWVPSCVKDESTVSSSVASIATVDPVCSHDLNIAAVKSRKLFWEGM